MGSEPYTKTNIKEFEKRRKRLRELNITLDEKITYEKKLRGIYGFFAVDPDGSESCFYIGKANDILLRMIGKGHFTVYLQWLKHEKKGSKKLTDEHRKISLFLDAGYSIEVRVLQEVPYDYSQSFELNANRLSLAEISELVDHQINGECAEQLSENVKNNEKNTFEYYYPYALISHIKDFGYWYSCVLQYKDKLFSDGTPHGFPDPEPIRECEGFSIYKLKDKTKTSDELTLYLYGRIGGLLYTREPGLDSLQPRAKAYMLSRQAGRTGRSKTADGDIAFEALKEFLDERGLEITSKDVSGESDRCTTYHINYKKIK